MATPQKFKRKENWSRAEHEMLRLNAQGVCIRTLDEFNKKLTNIKMDVKRRRQMAAEIERFCYLPQMNIMDVSKQVHHLWCCTILPKQLHVHRLQLCQFTSNIVFPAMSQGAAMIPKSTTPTAAKVTRVSKIPSTSNLKKLLKCQNTRFLHPDRENIRIKI
ncbi:hypothetical protein MAR_026867 [Mya arenaria]|uniref:Uncharacterized protein n=1 Tax=Mya arenaria TaxID=6604 RepID=A0ABY7EUR8_MYAAR|nr:hypothetical protein MAR_026867 [Mya arenaria]